ncbi:MAG: sulfurtransferase [Intrasporangium sp.]|uniref:sulfurtransferase n=1 Tax=Intrasporangium sp. TaxID=1925024 RepID=UPI00264883D1|nr:sulfurtransferase [Intrasporangium sp.]MDN5796914.1 sulfurtransferase [Intrasporangium sp.]
MTHLISAAQLAHEIEDLVVIDVRWTLTTGGARNPGIDEYAAGHVPGAFFVDLESTLAAPPGPGGRHPLPEPAVVEAALRRCGVSDRSRVIVYDARESYAAGRAWWVLRWVGLDDVRVLDGGFGAWVEARLPVSTGTPDERAGTVVARPGSMPTIDADAAADWARTGLLLDARAHERYTGQVEPIDPVAGHIPGAVNAPTSAWLAADGTFRPDLAEHWAQVGDGREGQPVAVYCGSGVTAAHEVLALAELGIDATLYPGSWSEWVCDPSRPVATGPSPG